MENFRFLKRYKELLIIGILFVLPIFISAYDDVTTHAALTQEITKLFNKHFPLLTLNDNEAELVIQGSIDEDAGTRWMQHFYDPVYNRGFNYGREWMSSKEWAQNTKAQAGFLASTFAGTLKSYFGNEDDYSWDRAIYEYVWGDKKYALKSLGHVLHLIEDAGVPDHTRNDPHPPYLHFGSPYESWTKKFDRKGFNFALNNQPIILSSIDSYFDSIAIYSNNNFFSKDTICGNIYKLPNIDFEKSEVLSDSKKYTFGFKKDGSTSYRLVARSTDSAWLDAKNDGECKLFLDDNDNLILTDYWTRLSRQAVLHGAGAIKLFLDEVEKEKRTKTLYDKNRSWITEQIEKFKNNAFALAGILYGSSVTNADLEDTEGSPSTPQLEQSSSAGQAGPGTNNKKIDDNRGLASDEEAKPPTTLEVDRPAPQAQPEVRPLTTTPETIEVEPPREVQPPTNPPTKPPKTSNTSAGLPIAGVGGPVAKEEAPLPSGSDASSSPPPPPAPDTTAPDVSLTVSECGESLSSDGCLVATTTLNILWLSSADDLDYYELTINGAVSTTTATSTIITVPDNATSTISVRARDIIGNWSSVQTKTVEITTLPVVINEIAWMGTSASSNDEWVELYNNTSKEISLAGWTLKAEDGVPYLNLSGTIPANGFYLIERTDDSTISDITADLVVPFSGTGSGSGLGNGGETLELLNGSTTIDKTPPDGACGGWCGGDGSPNYFSMERYDPSAKGENASNWGTWASFLSNGKNADNADIKGTPGKRNSINYYIDKSGTSLSASKTLKKSSSPYLIPSAGFTVQNGATLTIEPGVVIKFMGPGGPPFLIINGALKAQGTAADKIVFTSYHDDSYGGDTNQNASSTTPAPGDWGSIKIMAGGSVFDYTIIRYGGVEDFLNNYRANIRVENASVSLKNSLIEKAKLYGVWMRGGSGTIENNIFRENNRNESGQTPGVGLVLSSTSTPAVANNQFTENNKGILIETESAPTVSGNSFTDNLNAAAESSGAYPVFSANTVSGNGKNGIMLSGTVTKDFSLSANLPYIIQNNTYTVTRGNTLTLPAGTIIKLEGTGSISIKGKLNASGTASQKIIFTSLHDDDCGISGGCGDTNGTTTAPAAGDWDNITFTSTAASTTLEYFSIRYGGSSDSPVFNPPRGALRLIGAALDIKNAVVENNYLVGIWMQNSTSTLIADSIIQDHTAPATEIAYGIYLTASSTPILQNTTFSGNEANVFTDGTSLCTGCP